MTRTIIRILVLVVASTALLAPTAVAARLPKPKHNYIRSIHARPSTVAASANAVIAAREARGQTTNPGPAGNDTAPHVQPGP